MKKLLLPILTLIVLASLQACKKSVSGIDLSVYLQMAPAQNSDVLGNWILIATRKYGPEIRDTVWESQDTVLSKVTVNFTPDSVFSSNTNFAHSAQRYDRYSRITMFYTPYPYFRIYSTAPPGGNIANLPVQVSLRNPNAIVINYMGVDVSDQELYIRSGR